METDVVVRRVSDGLQLTFNRLSSLATGVAATAAIIGAATFATGPRSAELPALWAGVRAITSVPALAAISVLGMLGVGLMGTILLISLLLN